GSSILRRARRPHPPHGGGTGRPRTQSWSRPPHPPRRPPSPPLPHAGRIGRLTPTAAPIGEWRKLLLQKCHSAEICIGGNCGARACALAFERHGYALIAVTECSCEREPRPLDHPRPGLLFVGPRARAV